MSIDSNVVGSTWASQRYLQAQETRERMQLYRYISLASLYSWLVSEIQNHSIFTVILHIWSNIFGSIFSFELKYRYMGGYDLNNKCIPWFWLMLCRKCDNIIECEQDFMGNNCLPIYPGKKNEIPAVYLHCNHPYWHICYFLAICQNELVHHVANA